MNLHTFSFDHQGLLVLSSPELYTRSPIRRKFQLKQKLCNIITVIIWSQSTLPSPWTKTNFVCVVYFSILFRRKLSVLTESTIKWQQTNISPIQKTNNQSIVTCLHNSYASCITHAFALLQRVNATKLRAYLLGPSSNCIPFHLRKTVLCIWRKNVQFI